MTVVGVQNKQGNYQGNDYNNYLFHCTTEDVNSLGKITEVIKVKAVKLSEVFGHPMGPSEFEKLIGNDIRVYYDRYGQVSEISVIPKSNTAAK